MIHLIVCAGSIHEASTWAEARGISPRNITYASRPAVIEGMPDFAVVRLPGFFNRPDRPAIEDAIVRNERKARRVVAAPPAWDAAIAAGMAHIRRAYGARSGHTALGPSAVTPPPGYRTAGGR